MINFIISNSNYVLESKLIEKANYIEQSKTEEAIIITPEQFSLDTNKRITNFLDNKTMFMSEVHSFTSISNLYVQQFGLDNKLLNKTGKKIMLQKAVINVKDKLSYYNKSYDKVGFLDSLLASIDEIINSKTDVVAFEGLTDENNIDFNDKIADIHIIYKEFLSLLEGRYSLNQNIIDIMNERAGNWEFLKNKSIFLYGFNGFLKGELEFIKTLALLNSEYDKDINIFLTLDKKIDMAKIQDGSYYLYDFDPYYEPKRTLQTIYKEMANIENLKCQVFEYFEKKSEKSQLDVLKNNFFNKHYKPVENHSLINNVDIVSEKNKIAEINFVTSKIRNLIEEEDLRYSDFIILSNSIDDYTIPFKTVFEEKGVPYFIDKKENILKDELVKFTLDLFNLFIYNFNYESVFNFLKNEFCKLKKANGTTLTTTEVEELENYVLKYNLRGKDYKKDFVFLKNINADLDDEIDEKSKEKLAKINEIRETFISNIAIFESFYKKDFKAREFVHNFYDFLEKLEVTNTINNRFNKQISENVVRESSQIWNKYIDVLENVFNLIGEVEVNFEDMQKILEVGFSANEFGYVPNNNDILEVVDTFRSRFSTIKHLFIIGATEGYYPSFSSNKTFFNDDDVESFKTKGLNISSDSYMQMNVQNLNIYNAIFKAENSVTITYPLATVTGKSYKPSQLVNRVQNILNIETNKVSYSDLTLGELYKTLIVKEEKDEQDEEFIKKVDEYITNLNIAIINKIFNKDFTQEVIEDYKASVVNDNVFNTSISKIESYNSCPYSYFLRYDLKLYPREEFEVDASSFGSIYHSMLEAFFNYIKDSKNNDFSNLELSDIHNFVNDNITTYSKDREDDILNSTARYRYYVNNISETLKSSIKNYVKQLDDSDFEYHTSELEIKETFKTKDNEEVRYKGFIDRVDIVKQEDEVHVRTVDYKSSEKDIQINAVIAGKSLQLLKYLSLIVNKDSKILDDEDEKITPAGAVYLTVKDIGFDSAKDFNDDFQDDISLKEYQFKGIINSDNSDFFGKEKKDKIIGANSSRTTKMKQISTDDFNTLLKYVDYKVEKSVEDILEGKIPVVPVSHSVKSEETLSPCTFCEFKNICMISQRPENKNKLVSFDKECNKITEKQKNIMKKEMDKQDGKQ